MDCRHVNEQLGPYLDGELPPDVREALEAHLSTCDTCRAELESLRQLASSLAKPTAEAAPKALWDTIERRLDHARVVPLRKPKVLRFRRPLTLAASVAIVVGLGLVGSVWMLGVASRAEAATVNFNMLLSAVGLDAPRAFREFVDAHGGRRIPAAEAHQEAPALNFAVPQHLPGGFDRVAVYALRFGEGVGIAAGYRRDGDFLAVIFHAPVLQEQYGTHKDYPCVVGKHRGHMVEVGRWRLVHLTDPTTCHCVLSTLDMETELPAVMAAVAPVRPDSDGGRSGR